MSKLVLKFKPDGTMEVSAEQNAEKEAGWLLKELGKVERRGHKHEAKAEEGIRQSTGTG